MHGGEALLRSLTLPPLGSTQASRPANPGAARAGAAKASPGAPRHRTAGLRWVRIQARGALLLVLIAVAVMAMVAVAAMMASAAVALVLLHLLAVLAHVLLLALTHALRLSLGHGRFGFALPDHALLALAHLRLLHLRL